MVAAAQANGWNEGGHGAIGEGGPETRKKRGDVVEAIALSFLSLKQVDSIYFGY